MAVPLVGAAISALISQQYHGSALLEAIRSIAPAANVNFADRSYLSNAVAAAKRGDGVILFATKWAT
jgi:hypothetical protein